MSEAATRPIVRRHAWELDLWREQLHARAGGVEAATLSGMLRITPEPLIRTAADGRDLQPIRVAAVDAAAPPRAVSVIDDQGGPLASVTEPGPGDSLRVLVPAVEQPTPVRVVVSQGSDETAVPLTLPVVRRWTVHLVHHSHLDIGYTDPQPIVMQEQASFLDSALDLVDATDDWPDDARFRWCAESLWPFQRWVAMHPARRVEAMIERVRQRRIEPSALPFNLHSEACSTTELFELLRGARDIAERWGVPLVSAMQTDVPGSVAGLPDALGEAGVRYLSVAHNWAGRSVPHLVGGDGLPRLFRWRGAAGHEVLVWMTDTPHGLAYAEGALLGLCDTFEAADDLLPAYLSALASNPYPYAGGLFGWAADDAPVRREPYPHDLLHIRVTGKLSDNTAPQRAVAEIVRDWNSTWTWPRLRLSTNTDFFEQAEADLGPRIPTLSGDWNDWWADGLGSGAQEMALHRSSQATALDAASSSSLATTLGAALSASDVAEASRSTYESLALFDEHTWGATDPWSEDDEGPGSGRRQWHWKVARALDAHDRARDAQATALAAIGDCVGPSPDALASFAVVNTAGWTRTDVLTAFLPAAIVPPDVPFEVIDARDGRRLAADIAEPANALHRDSGRVLRTIVPEVPALSVVRLDIVEATNGVGPAAGATARGTADAADDAGAPAAPSTELANEHLSVSVDLERASIASIVEAATGRDLVSADSPFGFGAYVHDRYVSAAHFNHASSRLQATERLELLGRRSLAGRAVVSGRSSSAIGETIAYEFAAEGAQSIGTRLTLPRDAAHLEIDVRISKAATTDKESAYLAFPFRFDDPQVRIDVAGTIVGSGIEAIPGAAPHMRAMREWISLEDDGLAVAWTTRDAPLVHVGGLPLPFAPFPPTIEPEPGTIVSWVHNNVWDTNFPSAQGLDRTFRYRVAAAAPTGTSDASVLAHRTAVSASRPLVAVLARGSSGDMAASEPLITIEDAAVELLDVVIAAPGSILVRLRCLSDDSVRTAVRCGLPVAGARRATYLGVAGDDLPLDDDTVTLELSPRAVAAVRLTLDEPAG